MITLPVPIPDVEKKKASIKPFEAPQRSVKKINLIFISIQLSEMHRTLRDNSQHQVLPPVILVHNSDLDHLQVCFYQVNVLEGKGANWKNE